MELYKLHSDPSSLLNYATRYNIGEFNGYTIQVHNDSKYLQIIDSAYINDENKSNIVAVTVADDHNDGLLNTNILIKQGISPAAKYVDALRKSTGKEWYIPAINELKFCYKKGKHLFGDITIMSSTCRSYNDEYGYFFDLLEFDTGKSDYDVADFDFYVRPICRV